MRSTFKTIVFTSLALSLATGGAFAAGLRESHRYASDDHDYAGPQMSVQAMPVQAKPAMVPKAHLDRVLASLRSAERNIRQEETMHRLSASAARKLEGEANGIRHQAVSVASAHKGAIPDATFQSLKSDIRKLDRNIVRMS